MKTQTQIQTPSQMKRSLLLVLLAVLFAGRATAETLAERYWRIHRERNATTRYGGAPRGGAIVTNDLRLLEYVESTGTQYVDTGLNADSSLSYDVELSWTNAWTRTAQWPMGAWKNSSPYVRHYFGKTAATLAIWAETGSVKKATATFSANDGSRHRFSADLVHGIYSIDGVASTSTPSGFDVGMNFWLFARNGATPTYSTVRIYRALFWRSGVLVRDYQPMLDSSGVACLLDCVSGRVYYSATATPLVAGPEVSVDSAVSMSPEDQRQFLAPVPTGLPFELAGGDLWYDCLAIPEGSWLVECPIEGTTDTAWRAALCPSNILQALVWRHAVGLAPTNLPVTIGHDPSRVIGRIEGLWYEAGTGVVARISMSSAGYAEARGERSARLSPDVRCFTTVTNVAIRSDIWVHENQDWIAYEAARRGDIDADSITNVPPGVQAVVMAPVYLRGLSLVRSPLLPTEWQQPVPEHLRDAYPTRPYRGWSWRR